MILRLSKSSTPGVSSSQGLSGVRAALRHRTVAVGVATVLSAGAAAAQEAPSPVSVEAKEAQGAVSPAAPVDAGIAPSEGVASPASVAPASLAAERSAPDDFELLPVDPLGDDLESYTLPTVVVQGTGTHPTESGLTRLSTKLVDTPQTVVVVPEVMLQEQRAVTLQDALRNVSGITASAGEGGRQGDSFLIRGFTAQNDVFRDGGRDNGWYTRDTFNLENVEAFFGPSAVLFGRGSTGGAINLVTKKPKASNFNAIVLSAGTAPSGRVELDLNRVVDERVQVRLNVAGQLAGVAGRDLTRQDRLGVAPSIGVQLTDTARLEVDHLYQREAGVPDYGQPFFQGEPVGVNLNVPRNVHYGVRGSDTEQVEANILTARLLQELGKGSRLTNTLRMARVERFARPTAPRDVIVHTDGSNPTLVRHRFETETDNDTILDQLDLRFAFTTGLIEHTLNAGAELAFENRAQQRHDLKDAGGDLPADLMSPNPTPDLTGVERVFVGATESRQVTAGVYVGDQLKITKSFELLGSARFDWFQTDYATFTGAAEATLARPKKQIDRLFNWRVGAVVHPFNHTSLYAMYGTSSNPSAELGLLTDETFSVEPERNTNLEFGAKAELLDDRLSLAASAFRITKENARLPSEDPSQPNVSEGVSRVDGLNVNASGKLTRIWKIFANYTFMHSEILEHTTPWVVGQKVPFTPDHSASLWTTVEVLPRLTFGVGATGRTDSQTNTPTNGTGAATFLPGYVRFDAYASYAFSALDLQLNVNNLADGTFFETGYALHAIPAAARSAMLTARFNF